MEASMVPWILETLGLEDGPEKSSESGRLSAFSSRDGEAEESVNAHHLARAFHYLDHTTPNREQFPLQKRHRTSCIPRPAIALTPERRGSIGRRVMERSNFVYVVFVYLA